MTTCGAVVGHVFTNGEYRIFANEKFAENFMTVEELNKSHKHFRVIPALLWSW